MDIEKLATSAVEESISLTDILSPFINDGDREPSWDGHIYIFADYRKTKKGIKKVPVQVKGKLIKTFPPKKTPKYSVTVTDIDNWLNDGGVILFVVLMNVDGSEKIIYYCPLLPVKIRYIKKFSKGRTTINIPLSIFPSDSNQKVEVLLNFYANRQKQTSFANAPLYSADELKQKGVLENISIFVTSFGKKKTNYELDSLILQNDIYFYAKIKGSSIPQPLPEVPECLHITRTINGEIKVKEYKYYSQYRITRSENLTEILVGKSIVITQRGDEQNATIKFKVTGTLTDYIQDTKCMIAIIESGEIYINGITFHLNREEKMDVEPLRKKLSYYRDVKKMLQSLGVNKELECNRVDNQDEKNIRNFINAIVYNSGVNFPGHTATMISGRFKIANLSILLWADKDVEKGYKITNFFDKHIIALFEENDKKMEHPYPVSHYVMLKKEDFLEGANIDYSKIIEDLSANDDSPLVIEQLTMFMLEMLKAYDEQEEKNLELLETAEKYCEWLMDSKNISEDTMLLNRLQIIKRKRGFEQAEIECLQELRKGAHDLFIKCGANLLLGKNESAQDCFDEMNEEMKAVFIEYPICKFGHLRYKRKDVKID